MSARKFSEKMGDWVRHMLSCCDESEDDDDTSRPALQISGPTNFRREDISIAGLDPEQQRFIREKAISDAQRMWAHLQPLRSSPSGTFAERPNDCATATMPSYEDFITPRSAPVVPSPRNGLAFAGPQQQQQQQQQSRLDRVVAHGRKLSASLTKPMEYRRLSREAAPYEMKALMDSQTHSDSPGKLSGESYPVVESEEDK